MAIVDAVTQKIEEQLEILFASIAERDKLYHQVINELEHVGFIIEDNRLKITDSSREFLRRLHAPARNAEIERSQSWIESAWNKHSHLFANGADIEPNDIRPVLREVKTGRDLDIFRLARYTWSLPYSRGFGRRLQFIIYDEHNGKLMGILGLQSPPLDFNARDKNITYPSETRKTTLVNQMMDIYTLGAVPPYNFLLGGKLVALAAASNEVRQAYREKYKGSKSEMKNRRIPAHLVALTTTSAYGRSSIYNRLNYNGIVEYKSLGFTEGYGTFHLDRLYPLFKKAISSEDADKQLTGYGTGPRIKWQVITKVASLLGIRANLLRHGVRREAFLIPLVSNLFPYLQGEEGIPAFINVKFHELAGYWKSRWLMPRSQTNEQWMNWERDMVFRDIADGFGEGTK